MSVLAWLLGLARDQATTSGIAVLAQGIFGSKEEAALRSALDNAVQVTAVRLVEDSSQQDFLRSSLTELVGSDIEPPELTAGAALDGLESALTSKLASLWQLKADEGTTHASALGIAEAPDEVVDTLVSEFIRSLGLQCTPTSPLASLVALLQVQQNERDIHRIDGELRPGVIARQAAGLQATQINAWISLAEDPPKFFVVNASDAPIFDVCPTPALVAYGYDGQITAMVGHSPLSVARQIDPDVAWCWPLDHCKGWGGGASVRGQVDVYFDDAAGRAWLLAHDHLWPADDRPGWTRN